MKSPFTQDAKTRKTYPVHSGFLAYFPRAIAEVAHVSWEGNEQHHPGTPLHWDRSKSQDEEDAMMRHHIDSILYEQKYGMPNIYELAKRAWRAMADLEKACEERDKDEN